MYNCPHSCILRQLMLLWMLFKGSPMHVSVILGMRCRLLSNSREWIQGTFWYFKVQESGVEKGDNNKMGWILSKTAAMHFAEFRHFHTIGRLRDKWVLSKRLSPFYSHRDLFISTLYLFKVTFVYLPSQICDSRWHMIKKDKKKNQSSTKLLTTKLQRELLLWALRFFHLHRNAFTARVVQTALVAAIIGTCGNKLWPISLSSRKGYRYGKTYWPNDWRIVIWVACFGVLIVRPKMT